MRAVQAAGIAVLLITLITLGGAIVVAASSGEDFEWLATTESGLLIGASGASAPAEERTLEFAGADAEINFASNLFGGGAIQFGDNGMVTSLESVSTAAFSDECTSFGVMGLSAGEPGAGAGAVVVSMNADAGLASGDGYLDDEELIVEIHSSVLCTPEGNVVIGLGGTIEQERMQQFSQSTYDRTMKFIGPISDALSRASSQ